MKGLNFINDDTLFYKAGKSESDKAGQFHKLFQRMGKYVK